MCGPLFRARSGVYCAVHYIYKEGHFREPLLVYCQTNTHKGTPVLIRPVVGDDQHFLEEGMERLSEQSRYFRFLSPVKSLTRAQLNYFTTPDYDDHIILGALDTSTTPPDPVGIARFVRLEEDAMAEFAVTIIDHYHGQGIGSLLLAALAIEATGHGIETFKATVHAENDAMAHLCLSMGGQLKSTRDSECDYRIPLHSDPAAYPQTRIGDLVRELAANQTRQPA